MIVFRCEICGEESIVRTAKQSNFMMDERSPILPEIVYKGIHITFFARKHEEVNKNLTAFMQRDQVTADLCRDCLLKALREGDEVTREDLEVQKVAR